MASNVVEVLNTPPTAPEITIEPAFPERGDDLICIIVTESADVDDDEISYTFSWTVDGVAFTDAETSSYGGDTIPSSATSDDETWVCTVTPNDGEEDGPSDSAGVTIEENCGPLGGDSLDGDLTVGVGEALELSLEAAAVAGDNPAGEATIVLADASDFIPGDEVLILTMSSPADACVDTAAGYWEVHQVASVDGDTLSLRDGLNYSFDTSGGAVHQVVRIPHWRDVTIGDGGSLTATGWDGQTGGVLIFRARSVQLGDSAQIHMHARGYLGGNAAGQPAEGPRGGLWVDGGIGGSGGSSCTGSTCVGGAGEDGTDGGGGGGSGGANPAVANGGTCGGGGGGGRGNGTASGGGLGAGDGGFGGSGAGAGRAGGGGGGCAASPQESCADLDGQRLLLGAGGPAGASGGCGASGEAGHYDGDSACGASAEDGGAGGGVVVILAAELVGADGVLFDVSGGDGGHGGTGAGGTDGAGGGGGGSGAQGASGGTLLVIAESWGSDADRIDATALGGAGGAGGAGGDGACSGSSSTPGGTGDGVSGDSGTGTCAGGGGAGLDASGGAEGTVFVFGSWYATASFAYTADPVNMVEFYGGEDCLIEL